MKFTVTALFRASVNVELRGDLTGYPHTKMLREVIDEVQKRACEELQKRLDAYHVSIVKAESVNILQAVDETGDVES